MMRLLTLCLNLAATLAIHSSESQQKCDLGDTSKDLDLVVYGASGLTGNMAAEYLARKNPEGVRWAIAGRNEEKLRQAANKTLKAANPLIPAPEIIVAGLWDYSALSVMTKRARVVLSFAGPFEANGGEQLVAASVANCAHYVDISTETVWKSVIMTKYGFLARKKGLALVQSAGFNSMASDLLAMSAIESFMEAGNKEAPTDVMVLWTKLNGPDSKGMVQAQMADKVHGVIKDPYILSPQTRMYMRTDWMVDGMEPGMSMHGVYKALHVTLDSSAWGGLDVPVIRRSIGMKYPDSMISVHQAVNKSMVQDRAHFLTYHPKADKSDNLLKAISKGSLRWMGNKHWQLEEGAFEGMAFATGRWSAEHERDIPVHAVHMTGQGDPSILGSAKMATELALGLAASGPAEAGYLTPCTALGLQALEERLKAVDDQRFLTMTRVELA